MVSYVTNYATTQRTIAVYQKAQLYVLMRQHGDRLGAEARGFADCSRASLCNHNEAVGMGPLEYVIDSSSGTVCGHISCIILV